MPVVHTANGEAFAQRVEAFLATGEVENNLILANPASNRVYQRLGFQAACRYRDYTFEGDPVSPDVP